MKTAEEILDQERYGFSKEQKQCAINAMKAYASQWLDEAAEKAITDVERDSKTGNRKWVVDKDSILAIKSQLK